jgi:MscS family membrane protein
MSFETQHARFVVAFLIWISLSPAVVRAQQTSSIQQPSSLHPLEPSDTSSPAATLNSLIVSCNELQRLIGISPVTEERAAEILPTTERILDCLDLSELPKELRSTAGVNSALFLKEALDRTTLPADEDIPEVDQAGAGQPLLRWQIPHTRLTIARPEQGPQQNDYLFTPETVRRAAEFYRLVKKLPYRSDGRAVSPGLYDAYVVATKKTPTQSSGTSSPRGTLTLFLDSCNELYETIRKQRHFDRKNLDHSPLVESLLSCLDTSQLPEYSRDYFNAEAGVCLKEILDRVPLPPAEAIPGIESVETASGSEALLRWQVPGTQIVISKMQEGSRRGEFLFSAETVSRAPELYSKVLRQPYRQQGRPVSDGFYQWWLASPGNPTIAAWVDRLPKWFRDRGLGLAIWQWIGLGLAIPISLLVMFAVFRLGRSQGEQVREQSLLWYWLSLVIPVVAILIPLGFKYFAWEYLTVRGNAFYVVSFCAELIALLGIMGLIVGMSSRIAESIVALPHVSRGSLDANLTRIICRVVGIGAAVIVFLEGGRYLGFPLATLIASAGIGGLAIALSAQGLIKGMFGTVTILLDKPFRVGERIVVNEHDGFVEEIGLRSTKIRAFHTNHLISIPNDLIAESEVENIGKRKHIRQASDLYIPLDTPLEKVERAVAIIRGVLENHEGMDPEFPPRVYFTEFKPESFNIRFIHWFTPPNLWQHYAFCESVNLKIFRAFEEHGIQFSLPLRHTYWKHDDKQGPLAVTLKSPPEQPSS